MSSKVMNLWQKNSENENWFWEVPIILIFIFAKIKVDRVRKTTY